LTTENAGQPNRKHDDFIDFDVQAIKDISTPSFDQEESDLLDIIYNRKSASTKTTDSTPETKSKVKKEIVMPSVAGDSLISKLLNELDKLNIRLFIIGLLISMILSYIVYHFIGGRKKSNVSAADNTAYSKKQSKKHK
jgi:hypothetical protein